MSELPSDSTDLRLENEYLTDLKNQFGDQLEKAEILSLHRVSIQVPAEIILEVCTFIRDKLEFPHISSIFGVDHEDHLECIYEVGRWDQGMMIEIVIKLADREN
ncbi:MAG: NADH-quinone oxidoreductase subunit C, partial [Promethearchaeota archaeon]